MGINVKVDNNTYEGIENIEVGGKNIALEETYSGTKTITENGTHDVSGYASAEVNVPVGDSGDSDVIRIPDGIFQYIGEFDSEKVLNGEDSHYSLVVKNCSKALYDFNAVIDQDRVNKTNYAGILFVPEFDITTGMLYMFAVQATCAETNMITHGTQFAAFSWNAYSEYGSCTTGLQKPTTTYTWPEIGEDDWRAVQVTKANEAMLASGKVKLYWIGHPLE